MRLPSFQSMMGDELDGIEEGASFFHLSQMVNRFNGLSHDDEVPSGGASNVWTISIREIIVHDELTPDGSPVKGRVVFLCTPHASYGLSSHILPLGLTSNSSYKGEVDMIVYHLLALFTGYDTSVPITSHKTAFGPYRWFMEDQELANGVCQKLSELGIDNALCSMPVPTNKHKTRMEQHWVWYRDHIYEKLLRHKMDHVPITQRQNWNKMSDEIRAQFYPGLLY